MNGLAFLHNLDKIKRIIVQPSAGPSVAQKTQNSPSAKYLIRLGVKKRNSDRDNNFDIIIVIILKRMLNSTAISKWLQHFQ